MTNHEKLLHILREPMTVYVVMRGFEYEGLGEAIRAFTDKVEADKMAEAMNIAFNGNCNYAKVLTVELLTNA